MLYFLVREIKRIQHFNFVPLDLFTVNGTSFTAKVQVEAIGFFNLTIL